MVDRENVIHGLKCITEGFPCCQDCKYYDLTEDFDDCVKAIAVDALELLGTTKAGGWISVKDHPPEKDEDVIIYGYYVGQSGATYPTTIISDIKGFKDCECVPIAWMPIPELPKEEKPECD